MRTRPAKQPDSGGADVLTRGIVPKPTPTTRPDGKTLVAVFKNEEREREYRSVEEKLKKTVADAEVEFESFDLGEGPSEPYVEFRLHAARPKEPERGDCFLVAIDQTSSMLEMFDGSRWNPHRVNVAAPPAGKFDDFARIIRSLKL